LVGRLQEYKGVETFLEVARTWSGPRAEFIVAGDGPGGDLAANEPAVSAQVGWIDVDRFEDVIAGLHVLVLPYTEASQSGLVAWAMATGVPVVSTPVGGLREQVEVGRIGVVAHDISPQAVAEAIKGLVTDGALYRQLSEEGLAASDELSWDRLADLIAEFARSVPLRRGRGRLRTRPPRSTITAS
jgi:glycosyltransferase involved in cell wall biosynthesis